MTTLQIVLLIYYSDIIGIIRWWLLFIDICSTIPLTFIWWLPVMIILSIIVLPWYTSDILFDFIPWSHQ